VNVTLDIVREESTRTFRLVPNTTVLGQLDSRPDYTLTVTAGNETATETLSAATVDCNASRTTFTFADDGVTVRTVSTTMACQ